jgi:hypothetical protein
MVNFFSFVLVFICYLIPVPTLKLCFFKSSESSVLKIAAILSYLTLPALFCTSFVFICIGDVTPLSSVSIMKLHVNTYTVVRICVRTF